MYTHIYTYIYTYISMNSAHASRRSSLAGRPSSPPGLGTARALPRASCNHRFQAICAYHARCRL